MILSHEPDINTRPLLVILISSPIPSQLTVQISFSAPSLTLSSIHGISCPMMFPLLALTERLAQFQEKILGTPVTPTPQPVRLPLGQ